MKKDQRKSKNLEEYSKRRSFDKTSEPPPGARPREGRLFCIQKHDASRLHYDLRLELGGALLSWAVPKGPSLDPNEMRLAVHVEDHPIDYGDFEGTIPKGEYGGGTVMLWDRGEWEPKNEPKAGYKEGKLFFFLHGHKLRGEFVLIKLKAKKKGEDNWLLRKAGDEHAKPGTDDAVLKDEPFSVKTGRTMKQIAEGKRSKRVLPPVPKGAKRGAVPGDPKPQLASLSEGAPEGDEWVHELKYDGYRILARFNKDGDVRLITRGGKDWTDAFHRIAASLERIGISNSVIDGEVVALAKSGLSDFQALQNRLKEGGQERLAYYAFDILFYQGHDVRPIELLQRKELLKSVLELGDSNGPVRYSGHIVGNGPHVFDGACKASAEGIVSKLADAPYIGKRAKSWLKTKCLKRQEMVVGGWTDPTGARHAFGALLVGWHNAGGELIYAGRVGTGYTRSSLSQLEDKLSPLARKTSPFANPPTGADARGVHWVSPKLVVEVEFAELTSEGIMRHPSFKGLREDKRPKEVVFESATRKQPETPKVEISSPKKVLYPGDKVTKQDVADYYAAVADSILPYLAGRPLSLLRCPDGYKKECFFQKHLTSGMPTGVNAVHVGEEEPYITVDSVEGLIGLVQMGTLELHPWPATKDRLDRPDVLVFDLDPGSGVSLKELKAAARAMRGLMEALGLRSFLRTTGGKGLHVVVPIERRIGWDDFKSFAKSVSEHFERADPERFVATMSKAKRKGKIYVDYLRNSKGATAICSYSTRARKGAPVSMPLAWDELSGLKSTDQYTVRNAMKRLAQLNADPWAEFFETKQAIAKEMRDRLIR